MKCPKCGYEIPKRSNTISTRLHGYVTWISRESGMDWYIVKQHILINATMMCADGGEPYPYTIGPMVTMNPINGAKKVDDVLIPYPTSDCTNKQMMTACMAAEEYAARNEIDLPEEEYAYQ